MGDHVLIGSIPAPTGVNGQGNNTPPPQQQEQHQEQEVLPQVDPLQPLLQLSDAQREIQELRRLLAESQARERAALLHPTPTLQIAMDPVVVQQPTEAGPSKQRIDKGKGVMPSTSNQQPRLQRIQSVIESRQGYVFHRDRYAPQATPVRDDDYPEDDEDYQGEYPDEFDHDDRYQNRVTRSQREIATTTRSGRDQRDNRDTTLARQSHRNKEVVPRQRLQNTTPVPFNIEDHLGHQSARTPRYGSDGYYSTTPLPQDDFEEFDDEEMEDSGMINPGNFHQPLGDPIELQDNPQDWFPPAQLPQNQQRQQRVQGRAHPVQAANHRANRNTRTNQRGQAQYQ